MKEKESGNIFLYADNPSFILLYLIYYPMHLLVSFDAKKDRNFANYIDIITLDGPQKFFAVAIVYAESGSPPFVAI